ncbi:MAG: hypothetical protein WKG00_38770 [Polyangiaceae bacterium]
MGIAEPSAYYPPQATAEQAPQPRPPERDPLAAVIGLGERQTRVGMAIGVAVALLTHGGAAGKAMASLYEMGGVVAEMRASMKDYYWSLTDVEVDRPKPPPPPAAPEEPPAPEPEPVAAAPKETPKQADPYEPPPAAAQAQKILTAPETPDAPVDLTDRGFVSGEGTGPGYGQVAAQGTATAPTFNPNAQVGGKPGGTGTGPVKSQPAAPAVDKSRVPTLLGGTNWQCPFPPEADVDQVDSAVATVVVTVRPDGTAQSVKVLVDPGHGFGRAARMCALSRRWNFGLDAGGSPITAATPPVKIRFTR